MIANAPILFGKLTRCPAVSVRKDKAKAKAKAKAKDKGQENGPRKRANKKLRGLTRSFWRGGNRG
jgi:hypothetical protein